jgi:amino acid transporter
MPVTDGPARLRLFSIAGLGVNTIVGSGIFVLPAELARAMGVSSPMAFVHAAGIISVIAIAFAVCAKRVSGDGGAYLYAREAFGKYIGWVIGAGVYAATITTWSTTCAAIPAQLEALIPGAGDYPRIIATVFVLALGVANLAGARAGAWVSDVLVVIKIVPLLVFVFVGIKYVDWARFFEGDVTSSAGLGVALLPAFYSLSGFETAAIPAGAAEKPTRDVPIAVLGSLGGAVILYVLIQIVVIGVTPGPITDRPLVEASRVFLGDTGASVMAALATISMIGLAAAMALASTRLLVTLVPERKAVIISTVLAAVGTAAIDLGPLIDYTTYLLFMQYGAVLIAAPILAYRYRRR